VSGCHERHLETYVGVANLPQSWFLPKESDQVSIVVVLRKVRCRKRE
jgi:hypothetical protein